MKLGHWTTRDLEILVALAIKVRALTLLQIAETWWPESKTPEQHARSRMDVLSSDGLVDHYKLETEPMLSLTEAVLEWSPGQPRPNLREVAGKLQSRWSRTAPPVQQDVYAATQLAANLFGTFGGQIRDITQVTHDVHLGTVYLLYRHRYPQLAETWRGEDVFGKRWKKDPWKRRPKFRHGGLKEKDPDAYVWDERSVKTVIEFGGKYDVRRVDDFHCFCDAKELGYHLW